MTQIVHISTALGTASICYSFGQCLTFRLSDPSLPSDVLALLNGLMSTEAAGSTSLQMERRGNGAVTYVVSADGALEVQNASATSFDQIMSSFTRMSASGMADATFEASLQPSANTAAPNLSFAQLLIGLVTEGWITEAEGDGWLVGTLPAPALAVIATLPAGQQFAAKARAIRPSAVVRADPLVASLAAAEGKSSADIDAFFTTYAAA